MTQAELAAKTGIRPATINQMYHELIARVNLDYLSRICEVLDCEVADMIEYVPIKKNIIINRNADQKTS